MSLFLFESEVEGFAFGAALSGEEEADVVCAESPREAKASPVMHTDAKTNLKGQTREFFFDCTDKAEFLAAEEAYDKGLLIVIRDSRRGGLVGRKASLAWVGRRRRAEPEARLLQQDSILSPLTCA